MAAIMIVFYKHFEINSEILIGGMQGKIIDIDIRYVTLLDKNNNKHLIPNANILASKVTLVPTKS